MCHTLTPYCHTHGLRRVLLDGGISTDKLQHYLDVAEARGHAIPLDAVAFFCAMAIKNGDRPIKMQRVIDSLVAGKYGKYSQAEHEFVYFTFCKDPKALDILQLKQPGAAERKEDTVDHKNCEEDGAGLFKRLVDKLDRLEEDREDLGESHIRYSDDVHGVLYRKIDDVRKKLAKIDPRGNWLPSDGGVVDV